ncbi:pentatricopeptide repeat-containing protein At5g52850, chloroplastic [Cornus florida]|uniref:pentatricopeptide repeat-containing protein At5g52850, chloroplastic n=1 Tax=Cornus florida TaxID=4283 RepID=UPI00289687DC|nr:pentatricopeptide repeat-containing protein At5g52850, chloroplastic [Cornus florida]
MLWRAVPKISYRTELSQFETICSQVLSLCNSQSLKEAVCIHSPIVKLGLHDNLLLNNNLLSLYAKCFGPEHARHFFDEMPHKDVVSWTGMVSAYVRHGDHKEALEMFDLMNISGQCPNDFTLSTVLRSCSALGEFDQGTRVQAYMIKHGFESNLVLGSGLIYFYSKCDHADEAYKLFTSMNNGDTVSWTMMISSFVDAQNWSRAFQLYCDMLDAGVPPNEYTFVKLVVASSFLGLNYGKLVHAHLLRRGVELSLVLKTALVHMYSKSQRMGDAVKVSNQTCEFDVLLWTAIVSGFGQNLKFSDAIAAFRDMLISGVVPNSYTYSAVLNACSSVLALELGKQIHSRVIIAGLECDASVGNALVDMYMKSSYMIEDALRAFNGIASPNVISWTSLISGLAEHGLGQESFQAFDEMRLVGEQPNSFTLSAILGACGNMKSPSQKRKLHGYIVKIRADDDIALENALVDAYAASGMFNDAWHVISMMSRRDAITYTSLATRMNQMGYHGMALNIITHMFDGNVKIDAFSMAGFLSASAGLGAMEPGKQLHSYSIKSGLCSLISVSNGLVDLYSKCGCIHDLHRAFGEIVEPDAVSWNGLMFGLAMNGHISSALSAFEDMRLAGVKPDPITFLILLFASSRGGFVDLGLEYFKSMRETCGLTPQLDHYVRLVDLLGRAGWLEEAGAVLETMPFMPDALIYKTLLGFCKLHRNVPLGEYIARKGLELDPSDPAFYLLLANMYDDSGQPDLGEQIRRKMREMGLEKNPGQSWIEMRSKVHLFTAGDRTHPQINMIHGKIQSLIAEFNNGGYLYQNSGDSSYHSEKLAVAFGLLNAPSTAPIRIIKNTRICRDCHNFMMNVTRLVDREIIVRDRNCLHCFKKGECSCKGYW